MPWLHTILPIQDEWEFDIFLPQNKQTVLSIRRLSTYGYWKLGKNKIKSTPTLLSSCAISQESIMLFMNLGKLINTEISVRKSSNTGEAYSLRFCFSICHLANVDTIFRMFNVIHFIHIWRCYCKSSSIITEGKWCYAGRITMELAESFFIEWIPNINEAIRTTYKWICKRQY